MQLIPSLKKHLHLQPASSGDEPEPHYCHYVVENEPRACVCMLNVQVDFDVSTCTFLNGFRTSRHSYDHVQQNCSVSFILKSESG